MKYMLVILKMTALLIRVEFSYLFHEKVKEQPQNNSSDHGS